MHTKDLLFALMRALENLIAALRGAAIALDNPVWRALKEAEAVLAEARGLAR